MIKQGHHLLGMFADWCLKFNQFHYNYVHSALIDSDNMDHHLWLCLYCKYNALTKPGIFMLIVFLTDYVEAFKHGELPTI